jgi:hypothetical protein
VVLHLRTTAYFQLNDVGAAVWRILEDGATAEEVVHRLRESLGGAPPGLESDVARFLDELVARDLVALKRVS